MKNSRSSRRGGSSDPPAARRGGWSAVAKQLQGCPLGQARGQTLLEFALVAPLLLFFVLALVDFGIAVDRRLVLDHAVREGARYASVGSNSITGDRYELDVQEYAFDQAQGVPDVPEDFLVCYRPIDPANPLSEQAVDVSIDYDYQFVTPIGALASLGPSINLFAKASARVEQPLSDVEDCLDG